MAVEEQLTQDFGTHQRIALAAAAPAGSRLPQVRSDAHREAQPESARTRLDPQLVVDVHGQVPEVKHYWLRNHMTT